jgi:hypothetical protein
VYDLAAETEWLGVVVALIAGGAERGSLLR